MISFLVTLKTCWHSPGASCAFPSLSPCVTSNSVFYVAFSSFFASGCYSSFVFTLLFISYHCCSLRHPNCFHLCLSFNQPRVCIHTLSHVPPSFSLVFVSIFNLGYSFWAMLFAFCSLSSCVLHSSPPFISNHKRGNPSKEMFAVVTSICYHFIVLNCMLTEISNPTIRW